MRILRRVAAAAVASTLAVGLAGLASIDPGSDLRPAASSSRRAAAAQPLIEARPGVVDFSPNGDHRLDRGRIRFTLNRAARVKVTVRDDDGSVRGPVRLGRLSEGRHVWRWDGRDNDGAVVADGFLPGQAEGRHGDAHPEGDGVRRTWTPSDREVSC